MVKGLINTPHFKKDIDISQYLTIKHVSDTEECIFINKLNKKTTEAMTSYIIHAVTYSLFNYGKAISQLKKSISYFEKFISIVSNDDVSELLIYKTPRFSEKFELDIEAKVLATDYHDYLFFQKIMKKYEFVISNIIEEHISKNKGGATSNAPLKFTNFKIIFIKELKNIYEEATGKSASRTYNPIESKASGEFADFCNHVINFMNTHKCNGYENTKLPHINLSSIFKKINS